MSKRGKFNEKMIRHPDDFTAKNADMNYIDVGAPLSQKLYRAVYEIAKKHDLSMAEAIRFCIKTAADDQMISTS